MIVHFRIGDMMRTKDMTKKEAIYQAALDLIVVEGLSNTSMSKVAKNAHVSTGTIYNYFEDKEALFNQLFIKVKQHISQCIRIDIDNQNMTFQEKYFAMLKHFKDFLLNYQTEFLLVEQFQSSPTLKQATILEVNQSYDFLFSFFEQGKKSGFIQSFPNDLLIHVSFNSLMSYMKQQVLRKKKIDEDKLDQLIQISWDAISK